MEEGNKMNKKKCFIAASALLLVLSCVAAGIVLFASSPLHPKNITDETVVQKGVEHTVKLSGISEYNENGFRIVADGFYYTDNKVYVYKDEEGYACTAYDKKSEAYLLGEYNSPDVLYVNYSFTGESYKNQTELEAFFETPDRIYNFDINNLSEYIQDVVNYEKKFAGKATVKIYRGRCVITGIYIGDEKVLEFKK